MVTSSNSDVSKNDDGKDKDGVKLYRQLAGIKAYTSASVSSNTETGVLSISVVASFRDFDRKCKRKFLSNLSVLASPAVPTSTPKVVARFLPTDLGDAEMVSVSPSGKFQLTSRTVEKKRYLEISTTDSLRTIEVTKKHGGFFTDETFGVVSWSKDESKFVYIADRDIPDDDSKYTYTMDLGEGYTGKITPTLIFVDLAGEEPSVTPLLLDIQASQPMITPAGDKIIFNGIHSSPLPFGIRFCYNRRTSIYSVSTDGTGLTSFSKDGFNGRYPCLTPDGSAFLYLSHKIGGAHSACNALVRHEFANDESKTIVPIVKATSTPAEFPGIFSHGLTEKQWAKTDSGVFAIIQTSWRCQETLVAVNSLTGEVHRLTAQLPASFYSYTLYSVSIDGWIVAARSMVNEPPKLVLGKFSTPGEIVEWTVIDEPVIKPDVTSGLENISLKVTGIPGCNSNVEVLFLTPKKSRHPLLDGELGGAPLIVMPHGGPHGVISTAFSPYMALLVSFGFAAALVNYSGSTGYGDDFVQAVIGRVGELDLSDVNSAAYWASQQPGIDKDKVTLFGGSHGGFITAHLLGFEPGFYKAGILRNPVTNIGAMVANTDISDWCFSEAGLPFDQAAPHLLSPKEYEYMYHHSPVSVAHNIKAPVLLMLGEGDRRAPPSNGLRWAQYLQGAGKDVTVIMFPNVGHGLDSFEAERYGFDAILSFLLKQFGTPGKLASP
ncbi:hypothetical protein BASA83_008867 [Batrachochytrium salamandrivorans]|nr:hypothetical protein BASA62_006156 [Batrachochytrium salamandrivorans]KAH9256759.1 hypothetical protein BASA81_005053 [Batrachochytrium salamandrivorans]KAH9269116.1 hypothetical protein BASA83_008867 [Batrachochytrium salamandrivorans]